MQVRRLLLSLRKLLRLLDEFHHLVMADTPHIRIAGMNGQVASPLRLLHNRIGQACVACSRCHARPHELNAIAPVVEPYDIEIWPGMQKGGFVCCVGGHGVAHFLH